MKKTLTSKKNQLIQRNTNSIIKKWAASFPPDSSVVMDTVKEEWKKLCPFFIELMEQCLIINKNDSFDNVLLASNELCERFLLQFKKQVGKKKLGLITSALFTEVCVAILENYFTGSKKPDMIGAFVYVQIKNQAESYINEMYS